VARLAKGFQDSRYRELIAQLRAEREKQGLSQEALAERLGTHQQFVSRYEIGERRLDILEYMDVAAALGLEPSVLMETVRR